MWIVFEVGEKKSSPVLTVMVLAGRWSPEEAAGMTRAAASECDRQEEESAHRGCYAG